MGYCVVVEDNKIEVHSDMCDKLFEKKEEISFKDLEFIDFRLFEDVEEFLKDKENIIFCEYCSPESREYDEEWDDFYEEFDEDDEIDNSRCEI